MARSYLPPGFRFHPTDEELIVHYLKKKIAGRRVNDGVIGEIEIYKYEPADLPGLAILHSRDPEWFFFNPQDKKYLHGVRTNRTTRAGYWKATGKDRKISAGSCKGLKKTLIYYAGRAPQGERTDWVMHEYRLDEEYEKKMDCPKSFVLCRIRRKGGLGPRNGEQYGAPVLDESDEEDVSTSYFLEEACGLSSAEAGTVEGQVLQTPYVPIVEAITGDCIESFLQTLVSLEEQEQQPVQDAVLSVDDLLMLTDNLEDFAMAEPAHTGPTNFVDLDLGDLDNYGDLLPLADNESVILQDVLHQTEVPGGFGGRRALQGTSHSQASDDEHNGHFIELADLEEFCDEQGTLESADIEELLHELSNGVENPMSSGLANERFQVQSLQSFGGQSSGGLQYSGMVNEQLALEVPLDSSQGLNILDSKYTRLLTPEDRGGFSDDLPSGCVLNSHQEGGFTDNSTPSLHQGCNSTSSLDLEGGFGGNVTSSSYQEEGGFDDISTSSTADSHSHSISRADEPLESQLVDNFAGVVNLDMQGGTHSVTSTSQEETRVAHGERSINSNTVVVQAAEQPNSTAGLINCGIQLSSSVDSLAPCHSLPLLLARTFSDFLVKVNILPVSADELSEELDLLLKDNSKYSAANDKILQSASSYPTSLSISSVSLHVRVKLIDLGHTASTLEMELQWCVTHTVFFYKDLRELHQ